ncbi:MAG TPA: GNAT family N-acetyltransferase [Ignavibacteria bacterium]|nr:GNAT family N-acetyltransferase [Ignavibacteria bacterium]
MLIRKISDKKLIENHFRKNTDLNLYQLGDLDEFFWKFTEWFGLYEENEIKQIVLIYKGTDLAVIIALCDNGLEEMKYLIEKIKMNLPDKFYSHLSKGLAETLSDKYELTSHGTYLKMTLDKERFLNNHEIKDKNVRRLKVSELNDIQEIYKRSYPGNWFDKRMLETGKYFGYFNEANGKLAGVSGIHVYSPLYKVAVLGNITTDPEFRGLQICRKTTSALCWDLFETVDNIGLNVNKENTAAIQSYKNVGFEITGEYEEYMAEKMNYNTEPRSHRENTYMK